jgi:hypothetical protein
MRFLTPKGRTGPTGAKPVLGSVVWTYTVFRNFETFFPNVSWKKLRMSTNFMILRATYQKLWEFEVLKRSLDGHVLEPMRKNWPKVPRGVRARVWKKRAECTLTIYETPNFLLSFYFIFTFFFGSVENGLGLLGEWMYNTPIFWSLPLHLEVLNVPFFMEIGDFTFFKFYFF